MSDSKILLTYKDDDGNYQVESVWATKEGEYYRINNIPFLAPNVALNDLVKAEDDDGGLYYDELIEPSGHSVVQVVFFDEANIPSITKELEIIGCTWEGSHLPNLISVDIPKEVDYSVVKRYLDEKESAEILSFKEACLAHSS